MFQVGDKVAHPGHGGCIVTEIREQFNGMERIQYLVLSPPNETNLQILIAYDNPEKSGVRDIISEEHADSLLSSFSEDIKTKTKESNFARHRQNYLNIIKNGTLVELVSMIQELTLKSKLSMGDKELNIIAQKKLFSEISLAKDWEFQRVAEFALLKMKPDTVTA